MTQKYGVKDVVRYEINKGLIPLKIFENDDLVKGMDDFYKTHKAFLTMIIERNDKDNDSYLKDIFKDELSKFLKNDLMVLKTNLQSRINYIITFMKLIETGEYREVKKPGYVTVESIEHAVATYSDIDYHPLITADIPFSKLWILISDMYRKKFVDLVNHLYLRSKIIYKKFIEPKFELLYEKLKLPCTIYNSKIHGKGDMVKTMVTESVIRNKDIKDDKYRKNVIGEADNFIDGIIDRMTKNGLKDDKDFDVKNRGINPKLINSLLDTNKYMQDNLKNKKMNSNYLCDIGISLLSTYKDKPDILNSVPEFKVISNYVIDMVEQAKNKGMKLEGYASKLYGLLREIFYDPKFSMSAKQRLMLNKQIQSQMKIQTKVKYRKK